MAKAPVQKKTTAPNAPGDYLARHDGWVAGRRVRKGDIVTLTAAAARYEPVDPVPASKTETGSK